MTKCFVFDIDGVLLKTEPVFREICELDLKGNERWDYFHKYCNSDKVLPVQGVLEFWYRIAYGNEIVLCTARNEKCKEATLAKLQYHGFIVPDENIYMRTDGDYREATEVKKELLQKIMSKYEVIAFIDDTLSNCEVAKELGILSMRMI